jgi:hypothetical protein
MEESRVAGRGRLRLVGRDRLDGVDAVVEGASLRDQHPVDRERPVPHTQVGLQRWWPTQHDLDGIGRDELGKGAGRVAAVAGPGRPAEAVLDTQDGHAGPLVGCCPASLSPCFHRASREAP